MTCMTWVVPFPITVVVDAVTFESSVCDAARLGNR